MGKCGVRSGKALSDLWLAAEGDESEFKHESEASGFEL